MVVVVAPTDKGTFAAFYASHYDWAASLAFVLTDGGADAHDIAQDSLLQVRLRYDRVRDPVPYLRTCIVNACRSQHRRAATAERLKEAVATPGVEYSVHRELLDVVAKLSERQRIVVTLRYYEGLPDEDIAAVLNCRRSTVRSLAARALDVLKISLEDEGRSVS